MRLSAPKKNTFYLSIFLVVLGLLGEYGVIGSLGGAAYILTLVGYLLLAAGVYLKGF